MHTHCTPLISSHITHSQHTPYTVITQTLQTCKGSQSTYHSTHTALSQWCPRVLHMQTLLSEWMQWNLSWKGWVHIKLVITSHYWNHRLLYPLATTGVTIILRVKIATPLWLPLACLSSCTILSSGVLVLLCQIQSPLLVFLIRCSFWWAKHNELFWWRLGNNTAIDSN